MIPVEAVIGGMATERVASRAGEWEGGLEYHNLLRKA